MRMVVSNIRTGEKDNRAADNIFMKHVMQRSGTT